MSIVSLCCHNAFRYGYTSPACSNSAQDFSVPQRSLNLSILFREVFCRRGSTAGPDFIVGLSLSITNGIVSSKIYDKRDDFNFEIVNFPFLDGDDPRSPSYGVYISQLIRFARVCSNVDDFNNRNLLLTAKLLKQGYRYHKIRKAFSKFYYRHSELIVKYNIGLKTLLQQSISEPIFYGDLVYKFKRIVGKPNFSDQFKKIVKRYIRVGYNLDIMRQSACLVLNPITVYSYGFLFNCMTVGQASDSMTALT